jgi:hypothetical protein
MQFGNSCYKKFDTLKNNADAKSDCAIKNGQIAILKSEGQFDFVNSLRNAGQDVWVKFNFFFIKIFLLPYRSLIRRQFFLLIISIDHKVLVKYLESVLD